MTKRKQIITAVNRGTMSQAQAARAYGVSESMVSKLLRQWAREGEAAFYTKTRRPHSHPAATGQEVITEITRLRTELVAQGLDAGPATIRDHLRKNLSENQTPSRASIARILNRQNLVAPAPKKRPKSSLLRFEAELPNGCWQSDVTKIVLADGKIAEVITWLDDYSRMVVHLQAHLRVTVDTVISSFTVAAGQHGIPAATLTDNGLVYTTRFRGGPNRFEKLLRTHDVIQRNGRGNHPQTQGKVERFQQTMKKWITARPAAASITELNQLLGDFTRIYNTERIHSARRATPYAAYIGRPKDSPAPLPEDTTRYLQDRVDKFGKLSIRYDGRMRHIGIGRTHAGTPVVKIIKDRHVIIADKRTGEVLRELILDPTRDYQPRGSGQEERP
ncbi:DDE-type integrase/transposase/recombinase [Nesterenkonia lutea]|uniref:Transposase InsO family protein n=1 Tax=Nesterenkonia lutea TaxID=272919 RepID=A0ABR9JEA9_9MICC|nr:DDE-type integrase/transposase/recombinase [Nesterenkonia lutea]MBE1523143.1 transposase InsO family protein [Nesterenkonia lutea]MBE1523191.1 transposase InsO family protein [Nesterenkonia lutea]MBE1524249.1 transposase InsO family protein [Nesterenkonia lutea]MBE1524250.1 transposase InsO family protein [Nesterenkonia lutea]